MRYPFALLFLCIAMCTFYSASAQDGALFAVHKAPLPFSWQQVENKVTRQTKTAFIQQQRKHFPFYGDEFNPLDSLYSHLHFVDINNDGLNDVFYQGRGGGEPDIVRLYINTGSNYQFVFEDMQNVTGMEWLDKKLVKLFVNDPGCCDAYVLFDKVFTIDYDGQNRPVIKQISQAASVEDYNTAGPDSLFNQPFRFEVLNDNYKLRFKPYVDDTTYWRWDDDLPNKKGTGNMVGLLPEGATGTALAKKTDNTGRVWWYVEIDEKYTLRQSVLYGNDNKFPTKAKGWLSSRFVKVVGEK